MNNYPYLFLLAMQASIAANTSKRMRDENVFWTIALLCFIWACVLIVGEHFGYKY